jgi:hypothetical protein
MVTLRTSWLYTYCNKHLQIFVPLVEIFLKHSVQNVVVDVGAGQPLR